MKRVILLVSIFLFHNLYASEAEKKTKITDADKTSDCQFYDTYSNPCLSIRVSSKEFQKLINQNGVSNIEEIDPLTYGARINKDYFIKIGKNSGAENPDFATKTDSLKSRILRSISGDDVSLNVTYTDLYNTNSNKADVFPLLKDRNNHLQVEVNIEF